MKIRVLGCAGAIAQGFRTTSFLLDEHILVDAGSGVGDLPLEALQRIDHVLLTHSHLDHILSLPLLADAVLRERAATARPPISVHALPETLGALRAHLFNDVIWPDFTRLPSPQHPVLRLEPLAVGETIILGGRLIEVLPAAHTVPACGYAVECSQGWWVYTGDTGRNPQLWPRLAGREIVQLVIETAFCDAEERLAGLAGHLCPRLLAQELAQLPGCVDVAITHIKPGDFATVRAELAALQVPHRLHLLRSGDEVHCQEEQLPLMLSAA